MRPFFLCGIVAFLATPCPLLPAAEPVHSLRDEVRAALQHSLNVSKDNRQSAVNRLVALHNELAATQSEIGPRERARLRSQLDARLRRLSAIISRQIRADALDAQPPANASKPPAAAAPASVHKPSADEVLAQRFAALAGPGARLLAQAGFPGAGGFGAGAGMGAAPNAAAAQPPDNGQALVDLIQRTIEPASWDINGGPGSIVYFRPRQVLVVRNRSEVHEQLQDVVRGLRQ
jgi:hypothetical protein